jgi:hypothetical protein
MRKPETNEKAREACQKWCRRYLGESQCELVGTITVATRHACFRAGYEDWRPHAYQGKVPKAPPCL